MSEQNILVEARAQGIFGRLVHRLAWARWTPKPLRLLCWRVLTGRSLEAELHMLDVPPEVAEQIAPREPFLTTIRVMRPPVRPICLIFDGPHGPEPGRFIEAQTPEGRSIRVGTWRDRGDGTWALDIRAEVP